MSVFVAGQSPKVHVFDDRVDSKNEVMFALSGSEPEGFFVCDLNVIVEKYKEWIEVMPKIKPFYAVKCNNNPFVLKTLCALGTGFDCASALEIETVLSMGVQPDLIIYANPTKSPVHLQFAADYNISLVTFDNECELVKTKQIHPNAKLVLRFACDDDEGTTAFGDKFGCDPLKEGPQLLQKARDLNLEVVGVSFHIGDGMQNPQVFRTAFKLARHLFDQAERFGHKMDLIDIGGGFPGLKSISIKPFADVINKSIIEFFPETDKNVRFIAEPGRFFVASAFDLATKIHSCKTKQNHNMYYISDGYYGNFQTYIRHQIKINVEPLKINSISRDFLPSSIWGPTCDHKDQICDEVLLPRLNVGDWLVFPEMGAYSFVAACHFNGFQNFPIYIIIKHSIWLSLRNKSPFNDDDFSTDKSLQNLIFAQI